MVTSLLRPLFLAARQNGHTFFCKKKKNFVNTVSLIRPKFFGQIGDRINGVPLYTNIYGYELTQLVCQTKDSNIMTLIVKNDH